MRLSLVLTPSRVLTALALLAALAQPVFAQATSDPRPLKIDAGAPLTPAAVFEAVAAQASELAAAPYIDRNPPLPAEFSALDYDGYRRLRPRNERSLWAGSPSGFSILPVPRGGTHKDRVTIRVIEAGRMRLLEDAADFIDFQDYPAASAATRDALGFSGWRTLFDFSPDRPGDEAVVFQDGVYFRGIGAGHTYGLSARALALGVAAPEGEEFPEFTDFWIFEARPGETALTAVALVDTPSLSAAYRFAITPGATTVMDVQVRLFPRRPIADVGFGAMSSMYLHGAADRAGTDDFRSEVHDSDGLLMHAGNGEWIWRPVTNPKGMELSLFQDRAPKGFGMMQRQRSFEPYADLEARYERRPGLWVEPQGDWGPGHVFLLELPTTTEYNDNLAAFWRPEKPLAPGAAVDLSYRLHWTSDEPQQQMARVAATRIGAAAHRSTVRRFVIDYAGDSAFANSETLKPVIWSSAGEIRNVHLMDAPNGRRLAFELEPWDARVIELRVELTAQSSPQAETWLYRWTPD